MVLINFDSFRHTNYFKMIGNIEKLLQYNRSVVFFLMTIAFVFGII